MHMCGNVKFLLHKVCCLGYVALGTQHGMARLSPEGARANRYIEDAALIWTLRH